MRRPNSSSLKSNKIHCSLFIVHCSSPLLYYHRPPTCSDYSRRPPRLVIIVLVLFLLFLIIIVIILSLIIIIGDLIVVVVVVVAINWFTQLPQNHQKQEPTRLLSSTKYSQPFKNTLTEQQEILRPISVWVNNQNETFSIHSTLNQYQDNHNYAFHLEIGAGRLYWFVPIWLRYKV